MTSNQAEELATYILLGMTAVTGLVDAVSFLGLGRIFTANMTGNIVFLAFATAGVPGLSMILSSAALAWFLIGAALGGRIMARPSRDSHTRIRFAAQAFLMEVLFLTTASVVAIGYRGDVMKGPLRSFALIALT